MIDGILLIIDGILKIWKLKVSYLSKILSMNLPLSIEISKSCMAAILFLFNFYKPGHNILALFHILAQVRITASKTVLDI